MGVSTTFSLGVAANAAKIPSRKLRRWLDTNIITLRGNDSKPTGSGTHCGLSRTRILQAAITEALLKSGVSLSTATKAAFEFSDFGNAGRAAAQTFPLGKTILALGPNGPVVSNVHFDAKLFDISNCGVTIVVDLNKISSDVTAVLDNS